MKTTAHPLTIPGPAGDIEALLQTQGVPGSDQGIAVLCHPLPTGGGTMHNKVIYTMGQAFHNLGMATCKFHTRGTGASAGSFDHGRGERDDLAAVLEYCQTQLHITDLWLGGFSFGSYLVQSVTVLPQSGMRLHHKLLIAPPVDRYDYNVSEQQDIALSVVQGGQDELVQASDVDQWFKQVQQYYHPASYSFFSDASHFFHGQLITLRQDLIQHLSKTITRNPLL